jgi:hypothetical protein
MQEDQNQQTNSIEDNLPLVNYIMLHRIYDMLTLIAKEVAGSQDVEKMVEYHEKGYLLGPVPSYVPNNEEENK